MTRAGGGPRASSPTGVQTSFFDQGPDAGPHRRRGPAHRGDGAAAAAEVVVVELAAHGVHVHGEPHGDTQGRADHQARAATAASCR